MWVFDEKNAGLHRCQRGGDRDLRLFARRVPADGHHADPSTGGDSTLLQRIRSGAAHQPSVWIHLTKSGGAIDVERRVEGADYRRTRGPPRSRARRVGAPTARSSSCGRRTRSKPSASSGGIAHDFNNLLTAILGHTEMLVGNTSPGDRARQIAGIRDAADLATSLTRQCSLQPQAASCSRSCSI